MCGFTSLGEAIIEPTRVRIIAALRHGELCVCELVDALETPQSTLSGHLLVLRATGFANTRKEGRWIYYSLNDQRTTLIDALFFHLEPDTAQPRIRRDASRILRRLAIRENGICVLGFGELEKRQPAVKINGVPSARRYRKNAGSKRASSPRACSCTEVNKLHERRS